MKIVPLKVFVHILYTQMFCNEYTPNNRHEKGERMTFVNIK